MTGCTHDWLCARRDLNISFTIDDWQGPTDAIARCDDCGDYALLRLAHWSGPSLAMRWFAVYPLPTSAVSVFLRDLKTGYCDLARHQAEVEALYSIAKPACRLVAIELPDHRILASCESHLVPDLTITHWRDMPQQSDEARWQALLTA